MLKTVLFSLLGINPLVVDKIEEDHVEINIAFKKLYGFEIASNVEKIKNTSRDVIAKIMSVSSQRFDKVLYIVIRREKVDDGYVSRIYYLSYSNDILNILIENFSVNNIRRLKGYEIANVLYNIISLEKSYTLDKVEGRLIRNLPVFSEKNTHEIVRSKFSKLMLEIDYQEYDVYVGAAFFASVGNLERLFSLAWEGSLIFTVDFNDPYPGIKKKKDQAMENRKVLKEMEDSVKQGVASYVGISCSLITKNTSEDKVIDLFTTLGFKPIVKRYEKALYVYSPLYVRDSDYTFYGTPEEIQPYLIYSYEKTSMPKVVEVFGKNRYGSLVFYSFFEENNNPHTMIFAPSGAGKSFSMQNMITNILRIDVSKLLKNENFQLRNSIRIRYFDKGFSAEILFKLLKERKYEVSLFNARTDEITLNPCDVMEDSTDEYDFASYVTNICLQAIDMPPMVGFETTWFKRALREVYIKDEYKSFLRKNIYNLDTPAFRAVYESLLKDGYSPSDLIGNIKEEKYSFLKCALLPDLERFLLSYADDLSLTTEERNAIKSLITKIKALEDYPQLIFPTQINLSTAKIMYLDYEFLSSSRFFVPILLTILKRLTVYDKFYKPENEYAYYIIDEAHNLLRNDYFNLALKVLIREARKYRISLTFLTQNFEDVPPDVIFNADTIMFISPQEEEKRRQYLSSFYHHISKGMPVKENEGADVKHIYFATPAYTFTIWFSKGVFSMKLDVDEDKKKVFDSYRRELITDDGVRVVKSMALELGK